jgi:hypothetical protein
MPQCAHGANAVAQVGAQTVANGLMPFEGIESYAQAKSGHK